MKKSCRHKSAKLTRWFISLFSGKHLLGRFLATFGHKNSEGKGGAEWHEMNKLANSPDETAAKAGKFAHHPLAE